jgi:predicted metalloprotease with PDZ domain
VRLNIVADKPELLEIKPEQLQIHRNLVQQAYKLYGAHHYDHYDFLVALTDKMGGIGLEHHRSSENGVAPKYFTDWDKTFVGRDLLAHEYTHSWNGKFRRAADLYTPTLNEPMRDSLMWVYEGQTQYWGNVLAARSGLLTKQQGLDALAATAAPTTPAPAATGATCWTPPTTRSSPTASRLVDQLAAQRGLLFGRPAGLARRRHADPREDRRQEVAGRLRQGLLRRRQRLVRAVLTYDFDTVVQTLNGVVAYDWATFLKTRIEGLSEKTPRWMAWPAAATSWSIPTPRPSSSRRPRPRARSSRSATRWA